MSLGPPGKERVHRMDVYPGGFLFFYNYESKGKGQVVRLTRAHRAGVEYLLPQGAGGFVTWPVTSNPVLTRHASVAEAQAAGHEMEGRPPNWPEEWLDIPRVGSQWQLQQHVFVVRAINGNDVVSYNENGLSLPNRGLDKVGFFCSGYGGLRPLDPLLVLSRALEE